MKTQKGVALILAVGILALLAVIATSFALNMRLEYKAAMNYYNGVRARYLAEAALQRAITELKEHVKTSAFDDLTEDWAGDPSNEYIAYSNDISADGNDDATSTIVDEQRKINVNNANADLLNNLCGEVIGFPVPAELVPKIIANIPYSNLYEVIPKAGLNEVEEDKFNDLKNYITVTSYVDPNTDPTTPRSPVNVNTCSRQVLKAVMKAGVTISNGEANDIIEWRPFTTWARFDDAIDAEITNPLRATVIKNNCNPNRSDNKVTTEFCFNSGGYYQITGNGTVLSDPADDTSIIAESEVVAIVKIYDIYNDSVFNEDTNYNGTPDAGEDINGNGNLDVPSAFERITWLDSCPVNSTDLFGSENIPADAETINNSIKLGYWDNFDENSDYSHDNWDNQSNDPTRSQYEISAWNSPTANLHPMFGLPGGLPQYGKFVISKEIDLDGDGTIDYDRWSFGDFSMRVREKDFGGLILLRHAGQVIIGGTGGEIAVLEGKENPLEWGGTYAWNIPVLDFDADGNWLGQLKTEDSALYLEWVPNTSQSDYEGGNVWIRNYPTDEGPIIDLTDSVFDSANDDQGLHHIFDNQVRIWPSTNITAIAAGRDPNSWYPGDEVTEYYIVCPSYAQEKTFNIKRTGSSGAASSVTMTRVAGAGTVGPVTKDDSFAGESNIGIYCAEVLPYWDDIRIISPDGNFTSQVIDSSIISELSNGAEWGTITATVTIPSTADEDSESVSLQTRSGNATEDPDNWSEAWASPDSVSIQSTNADGSTINALQYKATLSSLNANIQETPVLEDITLTYLPKTEIVSYTVSSQ